MKYNVFLEPVKAIDQHRRATGILKTNVFKFQSNIAKVSQSLPGEALEAFTSQGYDRNPS